MFLQTSRPLDTAVISIHNEQNICSKKALGTFIDTYEL